EVIDGTKHLIDNPDATIEDLIEYIKAPDFPTGGTIYGYQGVKEAFETGRGRVVVRGKCQIENGQGGKETIIITEIPYQVNKANLVSKIAELVNEDKIEGITDIRDESDRKGLRIVVEIRRDIMASVVLSKLYKYTPLQSSFGVNNIALVNGRPVMLNLKQILVEFIKFRIEVIIRRTKYDLQKAEERAHILEGLLIALDNIDEVIRIIRQSKTVDEAREGLIEAFKFSEIQAKAILDMRLQRLVSLEIDKVREEYKEVLEKIAYYKSILASEELQRSIIKEELDEIKEKFGDKRRTDISYSDDEISIEDLIPNEEVVITISHLGYIKRTKTDEFKQQSRGGKGSRGSKTRDTDFIEHLFIANNHNYLLLFTEMGRCFWLRAFEIPEASKTSQGRVLQNILSIPQDDKVRAYIKIENLNDEEFINNHYIMFATKMGMVKKTIVEAFSRPRTNGINAITIQEGDQLLEAKLTTGDREIILANKAGRAIRFNESKVRPMGRTASGVKGMKLGKDNDEVIGMIAADPTSATHSIFVVSEKGNGKRSALEDYRITNRGGKGVKTISITQKTGNLIGILWVSEFDDLMITTADGIIIRTPVSNVRLMGRATQGVKVIRINDNESIADVTVLRREEASFDEEE
ncbi:MAG: DNA gyrase subunit A, partial [Saprospiraceae bacterium]